MRSPAPPGGKKISLKLLNDLARPGRLAVVLDGEVNGLPGLTPCALGAQGWRYSDDPPLREPDIKRMRPREADFGLRE